MPSFFTREAAASSCVDRGLEAHRAIFAPPAASTCMSAAVSVVTWRQAAIRTPLSGFSFANRSPMVRSTGMSFLAHSTRFLPAAASFGSLMSYPLPAAIPKPLSSRVLPHPPELRRRTLMVSCAFLRLRAVAGRLAQRADLVGFLPREVGELPAEVAQGRRLPVDRAKQVQLADDPGGPQVEGVHHGAPDPLLRDLGRAEGLDEDR